VISPQKQIGQLRSIIIKEVKAARIKDGIADALARNGNIGTPRTGLYYVVRAINETKAIRVYGYKIERETGAVHDIKVEYNLNLPYHAAKIDTIEGLAQPDGTMHPMQAAFKDCHGLQCGYCTPGMVMSAVDICRKHPDPSAQQIREHLEGNICRCTGYQNIVKAVQQGAAAMKA
jgi:hypothetical protein